MKRIIVMLFLTVLVVVTVNAQSINNDSTKIVLNDKADSLYWIKHEGNITKNLLVQLVNNQLATKDGWVSYWSVVSLKVEPEGYKGYNMINIISPKSGNQTLIVVTLPKGVISISDVPTVGFLSPLMMYPVTVLEADSIPKEQAEAFLCRWR